jgi:hypothetical protein
LWRLVDDFFIRPYRMPIVNAIVGMLSALALAGAVLGRRKPLLLALLSFGPFCILGWLMLDHLSASRFSIAWAPLVALAVADGSAILASLAGNARARTSLEVGIPSALVAVAAGWTLPALAVTHRTDSPPVQAIRWIRDALPKDARLYVHGSMAPYSDLLLEHERMETFVGAEPPVWPDDRNAWMLREGLVRVAGARHFSYPQRALWNIARQRYFEVSVVPLCPRVRFGEGWYAEERAGSRSFRWMGVRGAVILPATSDPQARLSLQGHVPLDIMTGTPEVTITLDGQVLDRFAVSDSALERAYVVESRSGREHELEIRFDRAGNARTRRGAGADPRDLGMRLDAISWSGHRYECGP